MKMSGFRGLETFISSTRLATKGDAIVAAIHWGLILEGFRCIGTVDEEPYFPPTERLPDGWNVKDEIYTLQYIRDNDPTASVYKLRVIRVDNTLIVNMLNSSNKAVKAASLHIDSHINDDITNIGAYKDPRALYNLITSNLTHQLEQNNPGSSGQTQVIRERDVQNSAEHRPSSSLPQYTSPFADAASHRYYEDDPLSVGRGDLDPLGRNTAGGGMLMDPSRLFTPFRQGGPRYGLPRGAIPPGARFDPFGPPNFDHPRPDRNRFGVPNPDHLPPPGYDDMFG